MCLKYSVNGLISKGQDWKRAHTYGANSGRTLRSIEYTDSKQI